ncbi:MAG: type III pantothenate kinase, partial [Planctomycetes bacterium]|nr:type III pantothenate kinase [Planctomycetota bacterium]
MRILADCGNSTVKLALAQDGGVWVQERVAVDAPAFAAFVARHGGALDAAVVLPGAQRSAEVFATWWAREGAGKPLLRIGHELPLPDLGQYPGCGADRIVAGLAACAQERHDVVVVDAGTATTLTAWRCTGRGRLLGGLILPGAQ